MVNSKDRNVSLDIIRVVAIIAVIVTHGVETAWSIHPEAMNNLPIVERMIVLILHTFGRIGVPLFLFLTGYLMLGRRYKQKDVVIFYRQRVVRLLIISAIWSGLYYLYDVLFLARPLNIFDLVRQLLFISDNPVAPHLWYMPAIIGLYLFIPFLSNILLSIDKKALKLLMIVAIFYLFFIPTCNLIARSFHSAPLVNNLELHYMGGICGVMMVIGYLIKKYQDLILKRLRGSWLMLLLAISFTLSVAMYYLVLCVKQYDKLLWYDSIFVLLIASCLFIIILKLFRSSKNHKLLARLSMMTFGCYLVHYIFVYIFEMTILKDGIINNRLLAFIVMVLGTMIASVMTTSLVWKSRLLAQAFGIK